MDEAFCKRLEALRERRSWSYADMSRATGLSERSCIAYERGECPPGYKFLIALRDLGEDIGQLLGEPSRQPNPAEVADTVILKAAQYKATLDAISAVLAAASGSKARVLTDEEEHLLASYRAASPRDKTLFNALCPPRPDASKSLTGTGS